MSRDEAAAVAIEELAGCHACALDVIAEYAARLRELGEQPNPDGVLLSGQAVVHRARELAKEFRA